MTLEESSFDALIVEVGKRCKTGVLSVTRNGNLTSLWWGDRTKSLGLAMRAVHGIQMEAYEIESDDDDDDDDETETELLQQFPQVGQYL